MALVLLSCYFNCSIDVYKKSYLSLTIAVAWCLDSRAGGREFDSRPVKVCFVSEYVCTYAVNITWHI